MNDHTYCFFTKEAKVIYRVSDRSRLIQTHSYSRGIPAHVPLCIPEYWNITIFQNELGNNSQIYTG